MADPEMADAPPFDAAAADAQRQTASERLLARLQARQAAQRAVNPREYAQRYVREQESLITELLGSGASFDEVLAELSLTFAAIPKADLRHALGQLRERQRQRLRSREAPKPAPQSITSAAAKTSVSVAPHVSTLPDLPAWADGSDQRADESDADYRLRKQFEGPPEARRPFIGEDKL
uniref:Uncharacterized protein n=1 Tax=mine drainage metagenome TaxID=410659 RepID=E6PP71_9ZZZZ